jgi:hypothetical protein
MGAGIAAQIKARYPEAFNADTVAYQTGMAQLGLFSHARVGENRDKRIVNLYAQFRFGRERRHLDYEALYQCLSELNALLRAKKDEEGLDFALGLPYNMGCVNAGGSWIVVEAMIRDIFVDSPIRVVIVEKTETPLDTTSTP